MACNLKTEKLLDCVLMEVCAVIGLNAVCFHGENKGKKRIPLLSRAVVMYELTK